MLQTSADHYGKYDQETKSDIARLKNIPYPHLEMCENTLTQEAYNEFFVGAICIQPYLPIDFADRISGITLDALSAGSPIVTTAGTWMARQVIRFDAGIVVETTSPDVMLVAIESIIANYNYFSKNSITAGRTLQDEHSAHHLANFILNN
jgi:glycosyltransferase involved in cell wall biosynthesis